MPPFPDVNNMYALLILFFVVSIVFSFLCSLWEAVLLSVTPTYAQLQINGGSAVGRQLKAFKDNVDRPLAGILTLNTIAHTVGAIGVGVQAASIWEETYPLVTTVVVPVVMTLAILIFSEIIPKTLGATYWQRFVPFTVYSLRIVLALLFPLVLLSQAITRLLKKDKSSSVLSRSEFLAMAEIGAQEGVIKANESLIISNLLRFHTIRAKDVMTPRTVVKAASEDLGIKDFFDQNNPIRFSRIPVFQGGSNDQITGYVLKAEVLSQIIDGNGGGQLRDIRREILVVPEQFPIPELFNRMIEKRELVALVVDEFGGMSGIVSMEDVIETLIGMEIVDEFDNAENMQALARQNWEKRARALGLFAEDAE